VANPGQDGWRARLEIARKWRDAVNKHGGDGTVVHLSDFGIKGNTHFSLLGFEQSTSRRRDVHVADQERAGQISNAKVTQTQYVADKVI